MNQIMVNTPSSQAIKTWIFSEAENKKNYLTYIETEAADTEWLIQDALAFYRYFYSPKIDVSVGKEQADKKIPGLKSWQEMRWEPSAGRTIYIRK